MIFFFARKREMQATYERSQEPYFSVNNRPAELPKTTEIKSRLLVDNRDRSSGTEFDFEVRFGNAYRDAAGVDEYEHVTSVELKMLALPKVTDEIYSIISITQINDTTLGATNNAGTKSFCIAFFDTSLLAPGSTKPLKDFFSQRVVFNPPLRTLDRLNVSVLKRDGNLVTTSDTAGEGKVAMLFEIGQLTTRR